jgi:nitroreductase
MFKDLVLNCRSYRRFYEDEPIDVHVLRELIDFARCSASASNRQPLKYILSCTQNSNQIIFFCLRWAAALKNWSGPAEGERPSGYVVVLGDKEISTTFGVDPGIAAQTILLGAVEKGFGGCMLANIDKEKLRELIHIPPRFDILLVIALGKPKEKVVLEDLESGADHTYYRDKEEVHHVPKRRLDDIIIAYL